MKKKYKDPVSIPLSRDETTFVLNCLEIHLLKILQEVHDGKTELNDLHFQDKEMLYGLIPKFFLP